MTNSLNAVNGNEKLSTILAAYDQDKLDSNSQKKVAESLLKESEQYSLDSNRKKEEAMQYLNAAVALEKLADAVRLYAEKLEKGKIEKTKESEKVVQVAQAVLEMPVPKDITPELLKQMADELSDRAKQNRIKADDLLKHSEEDAELSEKLKEQAVTIAKKDLNLSDFQLKLARSHNEGLKMVYDKLGIFKLDAEYKEQVAYAQKKAQEQK